MSHKNSGPPAAGNGKRYDDELAFQLWQEGKTDRQIAAVFGVSRTIIQRWRDSLELPSTSKYVINTKRYRLVKDKDGRYYAVKDSPMKRQK